MLIYVPIVVYGLRLFIVANPRHACAARVTVLGLCVFVYCVQIIRKNAGLGGLSSASPGQQPSIHAVLTYRHHYSQLCVAIESCISFVPFVREVPISVIE